MKKVLCFGDSNTFGFKPETGLRFSPDIRWTGVLQKLCGSNYEIIEAGCNNRTCFRNNPEGKVYTGLQILPEYLKLNPDIIILALGSNDLQRQYRTSLEELEYGLESLVKIIEEMLPLAKIIIFAPTPIGEKVLKAKIFSFLFDNESIQKSKQLADIFKRVADKNHCLFVDLKQIAVVSEIDGLHYDEISHKKIAQTAYELIKTL